jgi:hypothetical protein
MTQPQYAPQQPQMPGYPPQPAAPQYAPAPPQAYQPPPMGYPAPQYPAQQPGYPMPPYGAPQQQAPAPELATGTLDAFYSQPSSGGGAALKFEQVGAMHVGVVARAITNGDIQQQTVVGSNAPAFFKDGRPKFVMKVPLQVASSPAHTDGLAQWFCAGQARDELVRAMAAAGAPEGPPEAGAVVAITFVSTRSAGPGMNAAKTYQVAYFRPNDPTGMQYAAQCGVPTAIAPAAAAPQAPAEQPPAAPQFQAPAPPATPQQPQYAPPAPPQAPQQAMPPAPPVQQQMPQPPAAQAQPPAPPVAPPVAVPNGLPPLDANQQQLLAGLTGQQLPPAPVA